MGNPAKHRLPYDEQVRRTTSPEVLQYIRNMREEHDQLRRDVQSLTEVLSSSPVLASQHTMPQSRLREDETSTPAHPIKRVPSSDHEDPHQHESAPQVQISNKSLHPQDTHHGLIEELTHSLKRTGLYSQSAAQSPLSSGESSPQSQDLPSHTTKGEKFPPLLGDSHSSSIKNNAPHALHLVLFPVSLWTVIALIIVLQSNSLIAGVIPRLMMVMIIMRAATVRLPDLIDRLV